MSDLGIDDLEKLVRDEIEQRAAELSPESYAARWRAMVRRAQTSGARSARALGRFEHVARTVLHTIRKRRSA